MAMTVHVDIVSAEESIFSGLAEFVVLPGEAGELGIMPGHTPTISGLSDPGWIDVVVILSGVPVYYGWKRWGGGR